MLELEILAYKFRNAIDAAKKEGRFNRDQDFREFPKRCCGVASELLGRYLSSYGYDVRHVGGTYRNDMQPHAWLEVDKQIIIDITGDQFKHHPEPLKNRVPVYVGKYKDYYDLFEIEHDNVCSDQYPLKDIHIHSYMTEKELYNIILDYIREK